MGESRIAIIQGRAEYEDGDAVGDEVFPTAVQKRQGEDAEKPFRRVRCDAISP